MPLWVQVLAMVATPIFAAGGAWMGMSVKLEWHKAEIDRAHERIDEHDRQLNEIWRA